MVDILPYGQISYMRKRQRDRRLAELNCNAYVDGKGDLWIACADGRNARRLLRTDFTLPAWSEDGRIIAVAERQDRWEVSVVHLPESFRSTR